MHRQNLTLFDKFTRDLTNQPLSHVWTGYGSALFLDFGTLAPTVLRDGRDGEPLGEMSVMVDFGWRIEGRKSIICGSWSDDDKWERGFSVIRNQHLASISPFGRLLEIDLAFSNGAHCVIFNSGQGYPEWAIFDRRAGKCRTLHVQFGKLGLETES